MSNLQIQYSKELAKELGKIAVYLPGEHINVGDIITFPHGKSFLGKARPLGSFKKISSLDSLGINYQKPKFSNTPDTYRYSSKNAVNINLNLGGKVNLGTDNLPCGKAKLNIKFTSEGAIYFLGVNCDKKELIDLIGLEKEINDKGKNLLWKDTFLVTSVTIAKKAFIAQSRSKSSELILNGDVEGIKSGDVDVSAQADVMIQKQQGDIFIKDWSNNVTVFMDLVKFEKEVFGKQYRDFKSTPDNEQDRYKISLKPVQIVTLLTE